jgi:hypothetical protein
MKKIKQKSTIDPLLLKKKTLLSLVKRKSEASDESVRKGKNPAVKSRLYKKAF